MDRTDAIEMLSERLFADPAVHAVAPSGTDGICLFVDRSALPGDVAKVQGIAQRIAGPYAVQIVRESKPVVQS